MVDSLVPPVPDDPPTPPVVPDVAARERARTCGFCESTLDARGGVLKRGARVQEFLDHEDRIRDARAKLTKAEETISALRDELAETRRKLDRYTSRQFGATL